MVTFCFRHASETAVPFLNTVEGGKPTGNGTQEDDRIIRGIDA